MKGWWSGMTMMSKPYQLMKEDYPWTPEFTDAFESYDAAMDEAVRLFDAGEIEDFGIVDTRTGQTFVINGYTLVKETCPICGKEVRRYQMERTHDCHGIPFRLVCGRCFDRIMEDPGYDGEQYMEADECLDYDY